jgi:hypothetical protein
MALSPLFVFDRIVAGLVVHTFFDVAPRGERKY